MDISQLQQAIARNQAAKQQLSGLDEQYAVSSALRDEAAPQLNPQTGTVSPLAVLANVINKSRGRMETRDIESQRKPLRQDIAAGDSAVQGSNLKLALEKAAMDKEKAGRDAEAHRLKMSRNIGSAENWTNGKQKLAVIRNAQGEPVVANGPLRGKTPPADYYVSDKSAGTRYGGQKAVSSKDLDKWVSYGNQVRKTSEVVGRFKPEYAQPAGIPTKTLNNLLRSASRADLLQYIASPEIDTSTKEALQWWADWKMIYELPQRHEYFGATLTNNEVRSWEDAVHMVMGMNPGEVGKRMSKLHGDLQGDFGNRMKAQHTRASRNQDKEAIRGIFSDAGGQITQAGEFVYGQTPSANVDYQNVYSTLPPEDVAKIEAIRDPEVKKRVLERLAGGAQ